MNTTHEGKPAVTLGNLSDAKSRFVASASSAKSARYFSQCGSVLVYGSLTLKANYVRGRHLKRGLGYNNSTCSIKDFLYV